MNRIEAEKIIRSIGRTCKGPWLKEYNDAKKQQIVKAVNRLNTDKETKNLKEGTTELKVEDIKSNPRAYVKSLLLEGNITSDIPGVIEALSRVRCGYDFNNTIVAGEFDGKEHEYKCPKCGVTGVYGAPYFEIE